MLLVFAVSQKFHSSLFERAYLAPLFQFVFIHAFLVIHKYWTLHSWQRTPTRFLETYWTWSIICFESCDFKNSDTGISSFVAFGLKRLFSDIYLMDPPLEVTSVFLFVVKSILARESFLLTLNFLVHDRWCTDSGIESLGIIFFHALTQDFILLSTAFSWH